MLAPIIGLIYRTIHLFRSINGFKLKLCVSHYKTIQLVDSLGLSFDQDVFNWKQECEETNFSFGGDSVVDLLELSQ